VPMRRFLILSCLVALVGPAPALAQTAPVNPATPAPAAAPAPGDAGVAAEPAPAPEPSEPAPAPGDDPGAAPAPGGGLTPPALAPIELPPEPGAPVVAPGPVLPDPAAAASKLEAAEPPAPEQKKGWTAPESVFQLHGYMRMRGTLLRRGYLSHGTGSDRFYDDGRTNYDPFSSYLPGDRQTRLEGDDATDTTPVSPVQGGCGKSSGNDGRCSGKNQVSGDLRLRLKPEIHLSDDIRVKAWIDLLDNVGAGTSGYGPSGVNNPNAPSSANTIRVRRAWAEARNRDLGELRFGRMGADWGLGILDNGGDRYGIDSDFSSDVDRLMGITNLAGFYLMAAYDWASEGDVRPGIATPSGVPADRAQNDDLDVYTFAAAHRLEESVQQSALLRGEAVFNYGVYFVYRDQLLQSAEPTNATAGTGSAAKKYNYVRLNQTQYVPDVWAQLRWQGLRVEFEGSYTAGTLEGGCPRLEADANGTATLNDDTEVRATTPGGRSKNGSCKLRQLGAALEVEYRLFDERLGLYLYSGFASGDSNAYGLASTNDPSLQRTAAGAVGNRTVSTYQFHPDYRVDLILWRTLMGRVAGGYYFKPGVSYDFIRDPYGQLAGGRLDVIYSRAAVADQTWGQSGNLGLEMDLTLYYRSEDGPDPMDGFYGLLQGGVLFPFKGMNLPGGDDATSAMILRAVAGVAY